jgi:hypothetical protein
MTDRVQFAVGLLEVQFWEICEEFRPFFVYVRLKLFQLLFCVVVQCDCDLVYVLNQLGSFLLSTFLF